jgi:Leucine-rich repeat (LRR) protein
MIMKKCYLVIAFLFILVLSSCSKNASNEQLPEYCRSYAGFADLASKDFFELLANSDHSINRYNYFSVISEIELQFEEDNPNRDIDLSGLQCFQNLTSLTLIGRSFKDISEISALSNIQSLELRDTRVVSVDSFKNLSKISNLVINGTKTLQNVEGIGDMTRLTTLDLSDNGLVDIGELNALVNLENLYLNDNNIIYFPSINNLTKLKTLDISNNEIIQLGDDLSGLHNLTTLNASHNRICDISTLDDLEKIQLLDLSFNNLGCNGPGVSPNFDSLENAHNLETLILNDNSLTSIEGLRGRNISLKSLHLENNAITDLTPISEYTKITELVIRNNNIQNLDDLSGMTGLKTIDFSQNNITDFSNLLTIPNLEKVYLGENAIQSIPDIHDKWPNLSVLDLHSNTIQDTGGVFSHPALETLILYNNGLTELNGISDLPNLDELIIQDDDAEALIDPIKRNPNVISTLRNSFNNLPHLDVDNDHVLDLGFDFGPNVKIYNSISGFITIDTINWRNMDISVIDQDSIRLPNLSSIDISHNNIDNLLFIIENPKLNTIEASDNPITDLSLFNGTINESLRNLKEVYIQNLPISLLENAFIDLPKLTTVDLTGADFETLSGDFLNLPLLEQIHFNNNALKVINGSFKGLNVIYSDNSSLDFDHSNIQQINNSFWDCSLDRLFITNQSPVISNTSIINSFNNLDITNDSLLISQSNFKMITDSFNNVNAPQIIINSSLVESISNSFSGSATQELNLMDNLLSDLVNLNQISSVNTLVLSGNRLNTLSFVDGITNLESLVFENQTDDLGNHTLLRIDGINNIESLTDFSGDLIGVTEIDGIRNTGITRLDFSLLPNLTSITSNSFENTPLTELNLSGKTLSDIQFLQNLENLEELSIGMDVSSLSLFSSFPFFDTLTSFVFTNTLPISDFSALSTYDQLETLTIPSNVVELSNLDGLEKLSTINLTMENINQISNSFNNVPSLQLSPSYLDNYSNITTISNSFDLYNDLSLSGGNVVLSKTIDIYDSFHGATSLDYELEGVGDSFVFDDLSFSNITSLIVDTASFTDYSCFNRFDSLNNVTIHTLNTNVVGLDNVNILSFEALQANNAVTAINATLSNDALLLLNSQKSGTITIDTNSKNINIDIPNAILQLNTTNSDGILSGEAISTELSGASLEHLTIGDYTTTTFTCSTPLLQDVLSAGSNITIDTLEVHTNSNTLNTLVDARLLQFYADNLTELTMDNTGDSYIYNGSSNLVVNGNTNDLTINYDGLQSITLSDGAISSLVIHSNALQNVSSNSTVNAVELSSQNSVLIVSIPSITQGIINDDQLINVDLDSINADWVIHTTQPTLNFEPGSSLHHLDLSGNTELSTLSMGDTMISSITLTPAQSTLTLDSTAQVGIDITSISLTTLTINAPQSVVNIDSSKTNLNMDAIVDTVTISGDSIQNIAITPTSEFRTVQLHNLNSLSSFVTDAIINQLDITTNSQVLTIIVPNSVSTSLVDDDLTDITLDVSTNSSTITTSSSSMSLDVVTGTMNLVTTATTLTFNDNSVINNLNLQDANITTLPMGNSMITSLLLNGGASALSISGLQIGNIDIQSSSETINLSVNDDCQIQLTSTATNPIQINTTTKMLDLVADVDANVVGENLDTLYFDLPNSDLTIDADKNSLSMTLSGNVDVLTLTGDDVDAVTIDKDTVIDTLTLDNVDISSVDGLGINNLNITTSATTLYTNLTNATSIIIEGDLLNEVELHSNNANISILSNANQMILSGSGNNLVITNDNATTFDVTNLLVNSLRLQAVSLNAIDTTSSVTTKLTVETNASAFDLTTDSQEVEFVGSNNNSLQINSVVTEGFGIVLTTNSSILSMNAENATMTINGINLTSLNGNVGNVVVSGFLTTDLNVNINSNTFILSDPGSLTSLIFNDNTILDTFRILHFGLIETIDTNDSVINNVTLDTTDTQINALNPIQLITTTTTIFASSTVESGIIALDILFEGSEPLNLTMQGYNSVHLAMPFGSSLIVSGNINNFSIEGSNIDHITTTDLVVTNNLTITSTLITSLDFASESLLNSLSVIDINTLSNANMDSIVNALSGLTVTIISPIVENDIYNYYYTSKYDELIAQESIDHLEYAAIRNAAISESWNRVLDNPYMDYLDETQTKNQIDTNTLLSVDDYFNSYLSHAGLTISDLGDGEETTIKDEIQTTLNEIGTIMDETNLQNQVIISIGQKSGIYAQEQTNAITFTIG